MRPIIYLAPYPSAADTARWIAEGLQRDLHPVLTAERGLIVGLLLVSFALVVFLALTLRAMSQGMSNI